MPHALIVDDSKIVRKITGKILMSLGYSLSEAEDGQQALIACDEKLPDLIMLDWHMPVMNGLEFLKAFRARPDGSHATIIFCTTENEFARIAEGIEAGANEYVMKPYDEDIIRGKLEQLGSRLQIGSQL